MQATANARGKEYAEYVKMILNSLESLIKKVKSDLENTSVDKQDHLKKFLEDLNVGAKDLRKKEKHSRPLIE